nr:MAG TPA: hypothetical protein [Herelleviridae sp.]
MRKIVFQVIVTTISNIKAEDIKNALDDQLSSFSETANLCHEVSIVQDGQLESLPEPAHVPIPHYMPGDMNNPLIPSNRDYNDGVINIRQWTSSAE